MTQKKGQSTNVKKERRRGFMTKGLLERNLMPGHAKPEMSLRKTELYYHSTPAQNDRVPSQDDSCPGLLAASAGRGESALTFRMTSPGSAISRFTRIAPCASWGVWLFRSHLTSCVCCEVSSPRLNRWLSVISQWPRILCDRVFQEPFDIFDKLPRYHILNSLLTWK